MNDAVTAVQEVRTALVSAVAADIRRRRRRNRMAALLGASVLLLGVVAAGTAAGDGWLYGAPAPARIAKEMHRFERQTPPPHVRVRKTDGVPFGHPTAVAHTSGYTLYVLRTAEHECFTVVPNGGESCGPLEAGSARIELIGTDVHADPRVKEDPSLAGRYGDGTIYGHTSAPGAATVEIRIPGTPEPVTAVVDPSTGYFISRIGAADGTILLNDQVPSGGWPAVVRDRAGRVVARTS